MKILFRLLLLWAVALPLPAQTLPPAVQAALAEAEIPADALAAIVVPAGAPRGWVVRLFGTPVRGFAWQADRPMQPGSTMKLVTSIVALDRLGPNLRGGTELLSAAPVEGGVLRGDLILRGGADPELGLPQVWRLLLELREQGIAEIGGDIVLDLSLFTPARIDLGLSPFDEAPEFDYNVIPDALLFDGNLMGLELTSDQSGVRARPWPALDGVRIDASRLALNDRPCRDWDDEWLPSTTQRDAGDAAGTVIVLAGAYPRDCTTRTKLQLLDRTRLAEASLRTLWRQLGGRFAGSVREGVAPAAARVLARRQARPWGEVLRWLNKTSDNALTRLLYLQLGARSARADTAAATTLQRAEAEVRAWLGEQGIDAAGLVLENGSGLSRSERLSPRLLARMIEASLAGPHAPDLLMSLPVAGIDGTMRNRLKAGPATGWARLKTGTLRNVVALAGVVPGPPPQRRPQIFVAIVNHDHAPKARPALDALVDWVARGMPAE